MTIAQFWGSLLIFILCPLLGGLPLIEWTTLVVTRHRLSQLGTGNVSVSAAFYHGGKLAGILAVLSEAFKGIAAVLLARAFFPSEPVWELIALIALVVGRYWMGKGAGTTNVVWGIVVHDWVAAGLIFLIGGISFTILRDRRSGRLGILILLPLILGLRHLQEPERILAAVALSGLLYLIYQRIPDDLNLPEKPALGDSQAMFRFFRGDRTLISLDNKLDAAQVGQKAATLSQLKRWGYPVPQGWVLPAGDDPQPLVLYLQPSQEKPLIVRSSVLGEDSESASAAGQYQTISHISNREALQDGIGRCQASYNNPTAAQYRRERRQQEGAMAVLVQKQIQGVFSGVAFSRDPMEQRGDAVLIEGLPGEAALVVGGQATPQQYRAFLTSESAPEIQGTGDLPPSLIEEVAQLAREIEQHYHGIPQDIEWTYDGQQLWLLQARTITTLQPIWTRKIAAEVIPGVISPLTWSINRPLTCGVWGQIFTLVLGNRAQGLDFTETATLHYARAYFNATLLGKIFRRMGLPAESLEFLTRGANFSKPPISSTVRNLPGLLRLLVREWNLEKNFESDYQGRFAPTLSQLTSQSPSELSAGQLLERVETIWETLEKATYYSILAPLSLSLRQALLKVEDAELDQTQTPEVESLRSLAAIAADARNLLPMNRVTSDSGPSLFAMLAEIPDGESILEQFNQWLERYGYMSEAATDIATPRWKENPRPARELFTQFLFHDPEQSEIAPNPPNSQGWKTELVQRRLLLKASVAEAYNRLLAHLRWSFVALEKTWLDAGILSETGDIFFLKFSEIRRLVLDPSPELKERYLTLVQQRRSQLEQDKQRKSVPELVYGNTPASATESSPSHQGQRLQGIAGSSGEAVGRVKVLPSLQADANLDQQTIVVVPYTDAGWAPLLARAGGIIAEVGGRLSHGAIVAREYRIPAVMDIHDATQLLQNGQQVRLDGQAGIVEILEE